MIQCTPRGICSWDFQLSGEGHEVDLILRTMTEQGSMMIDDRCYEVTKHGFASGQWTFDQAGTPLYIARKPSPFTRTFEITGPMGMAVLKAESAMGRSMSLEGGGLDCSIAPDHAFTRRASITGDWSDFRVVAFAFFLTVIIWRRASNNNSGNVGAG